MNIFPPLVFYTNECDDGALQVRQAPQRRGTPRPNRSKPHLIRPVEDVTVEEMELVADNMTDKVYNSVTVSPEPDASSVSNLKSVGKVAFPLSPGFHLPPVPPEDR